MPVPRGPDTDQLLQQASEGDPRARGQLLDRHRSRLRDLIALRLDRRLAARVDPSDVVQETLAEAAARLSAYLRKRPMPFYPWLRQLALDRIGEMHRLHIKVHKRSVEREAYSCSSRPGLSARVSRVQFVLVK
jgi:RNA polymerase sigma-70 factor, ECF subfamily